LGRNEALCKWHPYRNYVQYFCRIERNETSIQLNKGQIFSAFIDRLWKAVVPRLITQMLEGLRDGKQYRFGSATVNDYGIDLNRFHLFSTNERVRCSWSDLVIGNGAGTFFIKKKGDDKVSVNLPYQDEDNVHILEAVLRVFWKKIDDRLSSLLAEQE
jgi:hypothetical protein